MRQSSIQSHFAGRPLLSLPQRKMRSYFNYSSTCIPESRTPLCGTKTKGSQNVPEDSEEDTSHKHEPEDGTLKVQLIFPLITECSRQRPLQNGFHPPVFHLVVRFTDLTTLQSSSFIGGIQPEDREYVKR